MSRWKAAGMHLLISICAATLAATVIYLIWYPPPYFRVAGGSTLMILIMGVDVVLGPCLTLAVFKSGKKGMRFDLIVIALLQICAFSYGMSVIARARPVFVVGEVDRFVMVTANALDDKDLAAGTSPEFRTRSWTGPRLVGAVPPKKGSDSYAAAMSAMAGKDIDRMPKYYAPYAQVSATLLAHSQPLAAAMKKSAVAANLVNAFLRKHGGNATDYRTLPLQGRTDAFTMVVSATTGKPEAALAINPW